MTDKTAGDYGVEIEKSMDAKNALTDVPPIVAEMRKQAGPPPEKPVEPPAPVNQGLHAYADQLDQAVANSNVAKVREICDEMIKVEPPTPPPSEQPPVEPPPAEPPPVEQPAA